MGETSTILRVIVPSEDELIAHIIITFRPIELPNLQPGIN